MKKDATSGNGCGSGYGATGSIRIDGNSVTNLEDKSLTAAETLALQAAAFIFADDDLTSAFVAVTGAGRTHRVSGTIWPRQRIWRAFSNTCSAAKSN